MRRPLLGTLLVLLLLTPLLTACGGDDKTPAAATNATIGLTFVPNIQFSPFYAAIEQGYYKDAGFNVTLSHHAVGADQFGPLVGGSEQMLMSAGDEVLMANAQGVELVYVAQVFRKYPIALIVPADSDINSVADLRGKRVGIPGEYGATFIGLLALLEHSGLTRDDIQIESVGFTQAQALLTGNVDAIMGYINNEPIQVQKAGMDVRVFPVSDAAPLVSNGLVVTKGYAESNPDQVKGLVEATLKGVQYVIDHPDETIKLSEKYVPGLDDPQQATDAKAVLEATIALWRPESGKLGSSNIADWQATVDLLLANGMLSAPIDPTTVYNPNFLPQD